MGYGLNMHAHMHVYLCELQVKVKDAMVWLALQEKKLQKLQKDSASETYFNKYHVSKTFKHQLMLFWGKSGKHTFRKEHFRKL